MAAYYVTTPIYYVNDAPHIGHAYTTTAGDVLTRWRRQRGDDVWYLTGVDEHGTKVERAAETGGVTPQEWVDRLVEQSWRPVLETIDAANDDFIRTTDPRHRERVQNFWRVVRDNGYVYEADYEGPYCVGCEEFKLPGDLVAGIDGGPADQCPVHQRPVEMLKESNWFFQLSAFADALIAHYEEHPEAIEPASAYNEVMSFLRQGLVDISMSRSSVAWGIGLPWDERQVIYVWFDALLNYITAVGYGAPEGSAEAELFVRAWPADVHLVGKDILRFHAVYWPAMLMAAGVALPRKVFAHGWLLVGGEKMSKTRLTGIAPEQIIVHFGSDAFRYYFMRAIQFGQDGSFSWEDMSARYTAELANGLGNLASRATAMVQRYRGGLLPASGPGTEAEEHLRSLLITVAAEADAAMCALDFSGGITAVRRFIDAVNLYVTEQEPWVLAKDDAQSQRLDTVLYTVCEALRAIATLYHPVMPKAMSSLWEQLGAEPSLGPLVDQRIVQVGDWGQLRAGASVTKGAILFPRLEEPAE
ncbi:MAG: methionine--tRNA ligase [Candidatus Nanopelagicales bacterium]|jgi:methionyl-tRNA synthetase|nr:methionine--tRNA ligase [Candidatus Nanopelagicales bacterium]MDP4715565.1 methionine--tRNA ligase [Candidatus Nanopelagicales bacterium]MDP4907197.1 methionine--tRNA ligase [Candidatus Nanopelagicales bacterium]MDP4974617.1 methionine--tRNA ligase [Candidatus Nanopelagicales bacterium]MDP5095413.1 methionine--tRNA ligase [Candidatus Nanopelagicales bacterium]